jgi:hypothetical protein
MSHADGHNVGQQLAMWMTPKEVGDMWSGDVWPERVKRFPRHNAWPVERAPRRLPQVRSGSGAVPQPTGRVSGSGPPRDRSGGLGRIRIWWTGTTGSMLAQRSGALIPVEHQEGLS